MQCITSGYTHAPIIGNSPESYGTQVDFLYELVQLDGVPAPSGSDSDSSPGRPSNELPERRAARGLFRWDVRGRFPPCITTSVDSMCPSKNPATCPTEDRCIPCRPFSSLEIYAAACLRSICGSSTERGALCISRGRMRWSACNAGCCMARSVTMCHPSLAGILAESSIGCVPG